MQDLQTDHRSVSALHVLGCQCTTPYVPRQERSILRLRLNPRRHYVHDFMRIYPSHLVLQAVHWR